VGGGRGALLLQLLNPSLQRAHILKRLVVQGVGMT